VSLHRLLTGTRRIVSESQTTKRSTRTIRATLDLGKSKNLSRAIRKPIEKRTVLHAAFYVSVGGIGAAEYLSGLESSSRLLEIRTDRHTLSKRSMVIEESRVAQGLGLAVWGFRSCYLERTNATPNSRLATYQRSEDRKKNKKKQKATIGACYRVTEMEKMYSWWINTCTSPESIDESVESNVPLVPRGELKYR
jgi:hypothetical protein